MSMWIILLHCAAHIAVAASAERTPTTSVLDYGHENHTKALLGIPPDFVTMDNAPARACARPARRALLG
jgi:hypothetical protein